jgi:histone H3/H4
MSEAPEVNQVLAQADAKTECNEADTDCSSHIFGRVKRPMIQRMAKAAGIRHVSTNLYDAIRSALHRYLKEQVALALSHVDRANADRVNVDRANVDRANVDVLANVDRVNVEEAPNNPVIPNKTFTHMVTLVSNGVKLSKPAIQALHAKTEAWWLELFQSVHMVSMHRGANVAQPSDLEIVERLRTVTQATC